MRLGYPGVLAASAKPGSRHPSLLTNSARTRPSRTVLFPDAEQRQGQASSNRRVSLRGRLNLKITP
jgi:hypothetical protein